LIWRGEDAITMCPICTEVSEIITHPCFECALVDRLLQRREMRLEVLERLCLCGAILLGQVAEVDDNIGV
jgi:hypothetical protein